MSAVMDVLKAPLNAWRAESDGYTATPGSLQVVLIGLRAVLDTLRPVLDTLRPVLDTLRPVLDGLKALLDAPGVLPEC